MSTEFLVEPNTFYRVKNVDKDVFVRGDYADTYDGSGTSGDITTASGKRFYLGKSVAPLIPEFAGSDIELSTLSLKFYPNTVSSSNSLMSPRFKMYKASNNFPLTEGYLNIIQQGDGIAAFCSFQNWAEPWLEESFSGRNIGFADREYYSKDVTTMGTSWVDGTRYDISSGDLIKALGDKGYFALRRGGDLHAGPSTNVFIL